MAPRGAVPLSGQTQPRHAAARHVRADTKAGRVSGGRKRPEIRHQRGSRASRSWTCSLTNAGPAGRLAGIDRDRSLRLDVARTQSRLAPGFGGIARIPSPSAGMQPRASRTARVSLIADGAALADTSALAPRRAEGEVCAARQSAAHVAGLAREQSRSSDGSRSCCWRDGEATRTIPRVSAGCARTTTSCSGRSRSTPATRRSGPWVRERAGPPTVRHCFAAGGKQRGSCDRGQETSSSESGARVMATPAVSACPHSGKRARRAVFLERPTAGHRAKRHKRGAGMRVPGARW